MYVVTVVHLNHKFENNREEFENKESAKAFIKKSKNVESKKKTKTIRHYVISEE